MKKSFCSPIALFVLIACAGCQNQFSASYSAELTVTTVSLAPYSGKTQVIESSHLKDDALAWVAKGYSVLGHSSFRTSEWLPESDRKSQAAEQGAQVGADIVLLKINDLGFRKMTDPDPKPEGVIGAPTSGYRADWNIFSALYLRKNQ